MNHANKALCDMRTAVETAEKRAVAVGDAVVRVVTTRRMRAASKTAKTSE